MFFIQKIRHCHDLNVKKEVADIRQPLSHRLHDDFLCSDTAILQCLSANNHT